MPGVEVFTAPWPFLFWRIRSSERFDKSPSPDEVANCAVHRADFTNNRRNTRGIKVYSSPIMIPRPSVFPVIVLASYDTESPRSTSYSVLPPCIERGRNLPNTITLKLAKRHAGMCHGSIVRTCLRTQTSQKDTPIIGHS